MEEWDSGVESWPDAPRVQRLCKHKFQVSWRLIYVNTGSTDALFGGGEQVKLFCKIRLTKDHCCPEEKGRELYYLCITNAATKA